MTAGSDPLLAVTMGDPAGVGPEVIVRALADADLRSVSRVVVFGDRNILDAAAEVTGADVPWHVVRDARDALDPAVATGGRVALVDMANVDPIDWAWGQLSAAHGRAALAYLNAAMQAVDDGHAAGLVTAPVHKEATTLAGISELGHMEILARRYGVTDHATMLVSRRLRCVHVSTHYSLRDALDRITRARVLARLRTTDTAFRVWGLAAPRIAVAAVNPHGGEAGLLGREEIEELAPAVADARAMGIDAHGPLPADSVFTQAMRGHYDAVIAMFHDQGHIPVKVHGFEESVSVALGLPIIRTSVDHGTAFDIAGKGVADATSMTEAIRVASDICAGRWLRGSGRS
jgi:4-hydroxythreonine-4-phosphate dehydrogenase